VETEDRLVIPAPLSAIFFPLVLLGLAGAAIYYGMKTVSRVADSPEYAALIPIGLLLIVASYFLYRSASRPLILDKKADRVIGYPQELSKALKVVVTERGSMDNRHYVVELVFPDGRLALTRSGWPCEQTSHGPDDLAKKIGAFLGIPAEPRFPFSVSFSLSKGLHLTEEQARDAEKAGVKVDPRAIK
jgi:hypothetical protein